MVSFLGNLEQNALDGRPREFLPFGEDSLDETFAPQVFFP